MRMKEILEGSLTEATFDLDAQVDYIYDRLVKEYRDHIMSTTDGVNAKPPGIAIYSQELPGEAGDAVDRAHELNPIRISYGSRGEGNQYIYADNLVTISMNHNVLDVVHTQRSYASAIEWIAAEAPGQLTKFKSELTVERIKGSIHHELSHWLDDTLHNRHITKRVNRAAALTGKKSQQHYTQNQPNVALTDFERDAQIHSIIQMKRVHGDNWDTLTFDDLLDLNASLREISQKAQSGGWYDKWKKLIIKRMHREGLLGKNMSN